VFEYFLETCRRSILFREDMISLLDCIQSVTEGKHGPFGDSIPCLGTVVVFTASTCCVDRSVTLKAQSRCEICVKV
jgi:hypothetical protein